jgi:AcrR family transcriptional regulator
MARSDSAENVARLLRATRDAVASDGPGVSVRTIAERAEVGVSTLYRHFPDKRSLVDAVSVHRWAAMNQLARTPGRPDGALSQIVLLAETFSRMVTADGLFIESAGIRVGRLPVAAIAGPKASFDAAMANLWVRAQEQAQVHRYADPRDLIELTGSIRDRARRATQLRILVEGICVEPFAGSHLLASHLRAPDPSYL